MNKHNFDDDFARLQRFLTKEAARNGDGVEVQNRRCSGIVGISLFNLKGGHHSVESEWIDDELDGLNVKDALRKARSIGFAKAEFIDRAKNEK